MTKSDPSPPAPSPASSERLDEITRQRALESLRSLLGDEAAASAWTEACRNAGVRDNGHLDFDEMERVADVLMSRNDTVSLVGSSLSIRVRTYRMLDGAQRLGAFLESRS